jgi:hypothetical protein
MTLSETGRPDEGERVALLAPDEYYVSRAQAVLVRRLAADGEFARAERIALDIGDLSESVEALRALEQALTAAGAPDAARRVAARLSRLTS